MIRAMLMTGVLAMVTTAAAFADGRFIAVQYREWVMPTFTVPVGLDSEFVLEAGEHITGGLNADDPEWDQHAVYSGPDRVPHITFKPTEPGLRTNIIITTQRRTYRFVLQSDSGSMPLVARFVYAPAPEKRDRAAQLAALIDATMRASPAPGASIMPAADPMERCIRAYSQERVTNGPVDFAPARVCEDGSHVYIELRSQPAEVPLVKAMTSDGLDTVNYQYWPEQLRYTVDGIPERIVLLIGRQMVVMQRA